MHGAGTPGHELLIEEKKMPYQVAQNIVTYCTRCKMELNHVISVMEEDRIVRVFCKTCKKEHAYRPAKEPKSNDKARGAARRPATKKERNAAAEWEKAIEENRDVTPKPYTLDGLFLEGEILDHKTFGLGLVKKLMEPSRMEVLFKDGIKLLVRGPR